jgi:small subunit ribosomal protein S4
MARYTGPKIRLSRKFGEALTPKAEKYLAKRNYRPGQHGQNPARVSEFGMQLREKQKAKAIYGIMEKQFRRYYQKASKKVGVTGDALMSMLEMRLDNVVFRMGFAITIKVRETKKNSNYIKNISAALQNAKTPEWVSLSAGTLSGKVLSIPSRDQIDSNVNTQLIVEHYSR